MKTLLIAAAAAAYAVVPLGGERPHTELESSTPARDTVITEALDNVILVFSGPVEAKLSRLRWVGPTGDTVALEVEGAPDQPHVLIADPPPAANGPQRLLWLTVSADGHQVSGTIPFSAEIPGLAAPDSVAPAAGGPGRDEAAAIERDIESPDGARNADGPSTGRVAFGGLGMFCLLGFAGLLWFGMGSTILDEPRSHRLASVLGLGAMVLLSLDAILWLSELRLPGMDLSSTFSIAMGTRTGLSEMARVGLAVAAFLLFTGTRAVQLGALAAMLAVVVGALGGHQATIAPLVSLPANGLHLGAAAVWTGGILLLGVWPASGYGADPTSPGGAAVGWTFERVAHRVSSAALLASGMILLTGIVQDLLYLPSVGALFSSTYGNLLLAKSAGFAALIGFGAYNRFRLIPRLVGAGGGSGSPDGGSGNSDGGSAGVNALRRSVRLELIVVIVVVLVAVALAQVPPPVE